MIGAIRSWGVVPRTLDPVVGWLPFVVAMLTGLVAPAIAARVALRRVVRGSPLAQLDGGDEGLAESPRMVRRTVVGLAVLALGVVMALAPTYASNVDVASALPGISGLVMALSIGPLSPLVVRAAAWAVRRPAARTASTYRTAQHPPPRRTRRWRAGPDCARSGVRRGTALRLGDIQRRLGSTVPGGLSRRYHRVRTDDRRR